MKKYFKNTKDTSLDEIDVHVPYESTIILVPLQMILSQRTMLKQL